MFQIFLQKHDDKNKILPCENPRPFWMETKTLDTRRFSFEVSQHRFSHFSISCMIYRGVVEFNERKNYRRLYF